MNARRRTLIVMFSGLLYTLTLGARANPNHLEPIPPYDPLDIHDTSHSYKQAVFTSLIGKGWRPSLWMIERPSFSREYAVMLWCTIEYDPNDTRPLGRREIKRREWVIEHVTPKEKIWRFKPVDNSTKVLVNKEMEEVMKRRRAQGAVELAPDIRTTKDVERRRITIPEDFAKAVQEAWLNTLQLTRYTEDQRTGLDGTTLEFWCDGLFGQTWSPETGLPAQLADLGRKLGTLALSDEKSQGPLLAEAGRLARKIAKEAEAEQIKLFGKKMSHITWSSVLSEFERARKTGEAR
jgi:hypothetical protein